MPSSDYPALYERAEYFAAGHADAFLKSIELDWADAETGSVEAPTGHVMLVQVSRDMIREWVSKEGDPWMSERRNFSPGWYIVRTDDNGLIWGMFYGVCEAHGEPCEGGLAELAARADFAEAEAVYAEWYNDEENFE